MNIDNRRLKEIQSQIQAYYTLLKCDDSTISERLTYKSKIECLEKEEKQILKRCDVIL